MELNGDIQVLPNSWVWTWIARLFGFEAQPALVQRSLERAAHYLTLGDVQAAQAAVEEAGLTKMSPEGSALARAVAARLGISAPDLPTGWKSAPWGIGDLEADVRLFDVFAGAAAELDKVYNKDQPRWPKGDPESRGGRFSPADATSTLSAPNANKSPPDRGTSRRGIGHNGGPPLDDPPEIPMEEPPTAQLRNAIIRNVAQWLLRRGVLFLIPGEGEALALLQIAEWLYEYLPYINAYLDKPKTLDQLNDLANDPQRGYDIHHIVEQTPGRTAGFSVSEIESPQNRIRISRLKHWEVNAWYGRGSDQFGGLSPRDYLRDKGWDERYRVGLEALRETGVLAP
jgi:hypothetical protein